MRLAMGTAMEVRTALLFSSAMLLQYHTSGFKISVCFGNVIERGRLTKENRRSAGTPSHHESRKVSDSDRRGNINSRINDETAEGKEETQSDEGESPTSKVGRETKHQQHDCAGNVGSNSVEVGLDSSIAQSLDDLRQEEGYRLQRYTQADLDGQEHPGGGVFEDCHGSAELELLVDDSGTVCLDTVDGDLSLFRSQEVCIGGGKRKVPEGEEGNNDGG